MIVMRGTRTQRARIKHMHMHSEDEQTQRNVKKAADTVRDRKETEKLRKRNTGANTRQGWPGCIGTIVNMETMYDYVMLCHIE